MSTEEKLKHSAETLRHYREFIALTNTGEKNVLREDGDFFYEGFKNGVFTFYGIECNPKNGEIIRDTQNPKAYKEYLETIKKETSK